MFNEKRTHTNYTVLYLSAPNIRDSWVISTRFSIRFGGISSDKYMRKCFFFYITTKSTSRLTTNNKSENGWTAEGHRLLLCRRRRSGMSVRHAEKWSRRLQWKYYYNCNNNNYYYYYYREGAEGKTQYAIIAAAGSAAAGSGSAILDPRVRYLSETVRRRRHLLRSPADRALFG